MTRPPFAVSDVGPVANDDGGGPVGVGVETAVPAPEYRLALAVVRVPVSTPRAGLGRALRRDGGGGNAEFRSLLTEEFSDMADSARLSLSLRLALVFLPGCSTVPRAEASMLMGWRLSTATSLGWASSRMWRICCRSWSRRWEQRRDCSRALATACRWRLLPLGLPAMWCWCLRRTRQRCCRSRFRRRCRSSWVSTRYSVVTIVTPWTPLRYALANGQRPLRYRLPRPGWFRVPLRCHNGVRQGIARHRLR